MPSRFPSLALAALLATSAVSAQTSTPKLQPIPQPPLESLEPEVRDHLAAARRSFDALIAGSAGTEAGKLSPADAYGEMGALYLAYRLHDTAAVCFANAGALSPQDLRWAYLAGVTAQEKGQLELAARELNRTLALDPSYAAAYVRLGEIDLAAGRLDAAQASFVQALKAEGTRAAALFGLGRLAAARQVPADAVKLFNEALRLAPEASVIHYPLAQALRAAGETALAQQHLAKRGEVAVTFSDPMLSRIEGVRRGAVRHLERAAQAERDGQLQEAFKELEAAVAADPVNEAALASLVRLRLAENQQAAALETAKRLVAVAPYNAQYQATLGELLNREGQAAQGLEALRQATELAPKEAAFQLTYAAALAEQGRASDAALAYGKALELEPKNPVAFLGRARALLRLGKEEEARNVLEQASAALPQDGNIAHLLARVLATAAAAELRDGRRAFELAAQVFTAQPIPDHGQTLAMAYAEQGKFKEALELQLAVVGELEGKNAPAQALDRAKKRLALYAQNQPCRTPWLE